MDPIVAARAFVDERFPDCSAAFVAGSFLRGEATATSDLDIVIVVDGEAAPYRETFHQYGWPIEVFVHTQSSIARYFRSDVESRRPSLPTMCFEGLILRDAGGLATRIKEEARSLLERGPETLSPDEMALRRYTITSLVDDLEGCGDRDEGLFIANDLAVAAADFILAYHHAWSGSGKWVIRALRRHDPRLARELNYALAAYYHEEEKGPLLRFASDALAPAGGRLLERFRQEGKRD